MAQRRSPGYTEIFDDWVKRDGTPTARWSQWATKQTPPAVFPTNLKQLSRGPGSRWRVVWVDNDGHQKVARFGKRTEAVRHEKNLVTSFTTGAYIDPKRSRTTVGALYEKWLPAQVQWGDKHRGNMKSAWRNHVRPKWEDREVGTIVKTDVQAWIGEMRDADRGVSTITHALHVLQGVLTYAVDARHLVANPATGVKLPKAAPSRNIYLTVPQVEALAVECGDYKAVVRVLAYCGLRWSEMTALRVDAVDTRRRRLSIHRTDQTTEKGGKADGATKSYKNRTVAYVEELDADLTTAMDGKRLGDRLFTAPEGGMLWGANFRDRVWTPALERARAADPRFPDLTVHDLRHTCASLMVASLANVKAVQRQLGHKDATTTLNTYADLFDDDLDDVASRMQTIITNRKG